jgi:hypothetical protein
MKEMTQGIELPNGERPRDYPQKFVHSSEYPPCEYAHNAKAEKAPSLAEMMKTMVK